MNSFRVFLLMRNRKKDVAFGNYCIIILPALELLEILFCLTHPARGWILSIFLAQLPVLLLHHMLCDVFSTRSFICVGPRVVQPFSCSWVTAGLCSRAACRQCQDRVCCRCCLCQQSLWPCHSLLGSTGLRSGIGSQKLAVSSLGH